jgi:dipeptidase D
VSGLKGGHSGVQIHEPLANAILLATAIAGAVRERCGEVLIARVEGGNAHNAIPRDAFLSLVVPSGRSADALRAAEERAREIRARWGRDEPGLAIEVVTGDAGPTLAPGASRSLLELLADLPHGVIAMSDRFPGKVETSANLARVDWDAQRRAARIVVSLRSFRRDALESQRRRVAERGAAAGAEVEFHGANPGWEPAAESPLLEWTRAAYRRAVGADAEVQVIHAGLECGVIVARCPGMDAVSFGPAIHGAHTPEERVEIRSPDYPPFRRLIGARPENEIEMCRGESGWTSQASCRDRSDGPVGSPGCSGSGHS